jgi:hypothetical protein
MHRKKISDTTALSLFIQQPCAERASSRARARNICRNGAIARANSNGRNSRGRSTPGVMPARTASTPVADEQQTAPGAQESTPDAILRCGGLRVMKDFNVFLTWDERLIIAGPHSAAMVTGVAKVGDTELATIAGNFPSVCQTLSLAFRPSCFRQLRSLRCPR